jgi:NADH-quinone oxidoreductase subunit N
MGEIAFLPIAPEVFLLAGALLVLMASAALDQPRPVWGAVAAISLVAAGVFSVLQWLRVDEVGPQLNFGSRELTTNPMVVMDHYSAFAGVLIAVVAGTALVGAWGLISGLESRGAEFVALVLLATAGLHIMAMSANLILLFIGLETASISLYVVAGFTREQADSDEAAMKYFLLGSFASAVFLYGVALLFAGFGTTNLYGGGGITDLWASIGPRIALEPTIVLAGVAMVIVGLGFKVSAAPFHQWAPDVYQGAPGGAVALMSAGVKVAGFAAIGRVLVGGFDPQFVDRWAPAVALLAVLSVVVGTALAIAQTDLKRMLAYSGVAHAGFLLTALVGGEGGVPAMWFYLATYVFALIGAFTVTAVMSGPRGGASAIEDYTGLAQRSPALAGVLALFMLSMGGIPFTAGFVGKLAVFGAAIDAGYLWLAVAGLVVAVAGLFFYLRVIVVMYFRPPLLAEGPGTATVHSVEVAPTAHMVLGATAAVTVVFGLIPWPLLNWVRHAIPV